MLKIKQLGIFRGIMKSTVSLSFAIILSIVSCNRSTNSITQNEPPIVDGFNSEYNILNASKYDISDGVVLQMYQNDHFVWFTYNVPEGSYGTMDMVLEAPNLKEPQNLHISAQVGDWPANQPNLAPQTPESQKWGITRGWTGNPLWFKKLDTTGTQYQMVFKSAPARELQLSKHYFGKGIWRFNIEIRAIKGKDGGFKNLNFPSKTEQFELTVY